MALFIYLKINLQIIAVQKKKKKKKLLIYNFQIKLDLIRKALLEHKSSLHNRKPCFKLMYTRSCFYIKCIN